MVRALEIQDVARATSCMACALEMRSGKTELKNNCACVTFDPVGETAGGVVGGKISTQATNS